MRGKDERKWLKKREVGIENLGTFYTLYFVVFYLVLSVLSLRGTRALDSQVLQ